MGNKDKKINTGIITENELLDLFATDKQKNKYLSSDNKFVSSNKKTVLAQAGRDCEIKDIGNRQYEITNVYKYPAPKNFNKMNRGIHKYLTPLILINLIAAKIHNLDNITFTSTKWYKMIDMINDNYINMKYNMDYSSDRFNLDKNALIDFFNTTDDTLIYYFKKSLDYLKEARILNFQAINWICVKEESEVYNNGVKEFKTNRVYRRVTQKEMVFIETCEQTACLDAGLSLNSSEGEKFYSSKSKKYLSTLEKLLSEKQILFCYKAYEIFATDRNIEWWYNLLNNFDIKDKKELVATLNSVFKNNILINAQKRITGNPEKRKLHSEVDINNFMIAYKKISDFTLTNNADKLDIPQNINTVDERIINDFIDKNVHIILNGDKINIGVLNKK